MSSCWLALPRLMVTVRGLIPLFPYCPCLLLDLDGAWMGMVGGHGEWRWTEERKAWWVLAKKDAGVIMGARRAGLRENFTVLIKTLHWILGTKCHKMALMRTSLTPASFFIILSSLAFPAPAVQLLCLGLGPCFPLVFEHPHQLPILQVSFPFPPPWHWCRRTVTPCPNFEHVKKHYL